MGEAKVMFNTNNVVCQLPNCGDDSTNRQELLSLLVPLAPAPAAMLKCKRLTRNFKDCT
jgi:hypothetical protein